MYIKAKRHTYEEMARKLVDLVPYIFPIVLEKRC